MKKGGLKRQAAITAASGAMVRCIGFGMRLWVSRLLGAEAMGVLELAASAHALAVTPGTAGIPGAVSRLAAKAKTDRDASMVLQTGKRAALRLGLFVSALFLVLSPWIARLLGDERTLPALILFSPCPLLIALSGAYDGLFFGRGRALPPNLSELGEQLMRLLTVAALAFLIPRLNVSGRAAVIALGALLGEAAGLWIVRRFARGLPDPGKKKNGALQRQIRRLSLPLVLNRLCHAGLRSLCAFVIPLRLAAGGLTHAEALSRLGMLNGMVMPLMFLPGLLTGALSAVGGPAMARCESRKAERHLAGKMLIFSLLAGLACAAALFMLSPFLSARLYRLPELTPLIRAACPLAAILALQMTVSGLMTGLGLQKKALFSALPGSAVTLLFTWLWTPDQGIQGAVTASILGHVLTLLCCLIYLACRLLPGASSAPGTPRQGSSSPAPHAGDGDLYK